MKMWRWTALLAALLLLTACSAPVDMPQIVQPPLESAPQEPSDPAPAEPAEPAPPEEPAEPALPDQPVETPGQVYDRNYRAEFLLQEDGLLWSRCCLDPDTQAMGRTEGEPFVWAPILEQVAELIIPHDEYGLNCTAFAILQNGELWGWGSDHASLGQIDVAPVKIMDRVAQVGMENEMVYVLDREQVVWGCGDLSVNGYWVFPAWTEMARGVKSLQLGQGADPSVWLEYADGRVSRIVPAERGAFTEDFLPYPAVMHHETVLLTAEGQVYDLSGDPEECLLENAVQVGGGRGEYFAVDADGKLFAWRSPIDRGDGAVALELIADDCMFCQSAGDGQFAWLDFEERQWTYDRWTGQRREG